jgi:hypothetical protein
MIINNISNFVLNFLQTYKCNNVIDSWNSRKNQQALTKIIKKANIIVKDPYKPKRGKSAYLFFCDEYRKKLKEENPKLNVKEIVSKLGILWKKMKDENSEELQKFENLSMNDRAKYKKEMISYKKEQKKTNEFLLTKKVDKEKEKEKKKEKELRKKELNKSKELQKSLKKEKREKNLAFEKFIKSKRRKTKKSHPELDSEGIVKYLTNKWEKLPESKKEKYKNLKPKNTRNNNNNLLPFFPQMKTFEDTSNAFITSTIQKITF